MALGVNEEAEKIKSQSALERERRAVCLARREAEEVASQNMAAAKELDMSHRKQLSDEKRMAEREAATEAKAVRDAVLETQAAEACRVHDAASLEEVVAVHAHAMEAMEAEAKDLEGATRESAPRVAMNESDSSAPPVESVTVVLDSPLAALLNMAKAAVEEAEEAHIYAEAARMEPSNRDVVAGLKATARLKAKAAASYVETAALESESSGCNSPAMSPIDGRRAVPLLPPSLADDDGDQRQGLDASTRYNHREVTATGGIASALSKDSWLTETVEAALTPEDFCEELPLPPTGELSMRHRSHDSSRLSYEYPNASTPAPGSGPEDELVTLKMKAYITQPQCTPARQP